MTPGKLILPKAMQQPQEVTAMISFPFSFMDNEDFNAVILKLDQTFNNERNKSVEAIAKLKGIKVNLIDEVKE